MSENSEDLATRSLIARKLRDTAMILPFVGIFLFLTPIPAIFAGSQTSGGIPPIFTYVYGVWLLLIVASAFVSSRIETPEKNDPLSGQPK